MNTAARQRTWLPIRSIWTICTRVRRAADVRTQTWSSVVGTATIRKLGTSTGKTLNQAHLFLCSIPGHKTGIHILNWILRLRKSAAKLHVEEPPLIGFA